MNTSPTLMRFSGAGIAAALLLGACSMDEHLQKKQAELVEQYKAIPDYGQLPVRTISWQQAVHMMQENNTEYLKTKESLHKAERDAQQVWRDMIPSVNFGYYYSRALFNNDTTWGGNGHFQTNIMFLLPELTHVPVDHYTRVLAVKKAELDCEMKLRELTASLYQLFREVEISQKEAKDDTGDPHYANNEAARQEKAALTSREQWGKLSALLGNDSARWNLLPGDLPRVTPETYSKRIELPSEESQQLLTLELEASRLRKLGVVIRYWPTVHTNFYSPSLFDSSGGNLTGFMDRAKDTRVSLNMYLPLDTRGDRANEYRTAEADHRMALGMARQKMREYKEKSTLLLKSWQQYRDWSKAMEAYIAFRRSQGSCHPDDVRALHDESLKLVQEMREQERKNVERECALIQEYGLP